MNLFKVLASRAKDGKGFAETQMSAVLAWFLHPQMEHGLGYEFLARFLQQISVDLPKLGEAAGGLRRKFRGEDNQLFRIELEESVESDQSNARIDIALYFEDWCIGIENKIYSESASDADQLVREYAGLSAKCGDKACVLVFLVPVMAGGDGPDQNVLNEYEKLESSALRGQDAKELMTWQGPSPSIVSIIEDILSDESKGMIEPVNEYTRHTLKAWASFIRNDFAGYDYDQINIQNNVYPKKSSKELRNMSKGYVGISGGMSGLLRLSGETLEKGSYQYAKDDIGQRRQWISIEDFHKVYDWKIGGKPPNLSWTNGTVLPWDTLYAIAKACCPAQKIFVGIQGGQNALAQMDAETIRNKKWGILGEQKTSQWISGEEYKAILDGKGLGEIETT